MASVTGEKALQSSEGYGITKQVVEKCSLTWMIENFSYFTRKPFYFDVESPTFLPSSKSKLKWLINLYSQQLPLRQPHRTWTNDSYEWQEPSIKLSHIIIKLSSLSLSQEFSKVECRASFQDGNSCEFYQCTNQCVRVKDTGVYEQQTYLSVDSLLNKVGENDILKIQMEIICIGQVLREFREEKNFRGHTNPQNKLIEDFSNLFLQQKFGDVVIAVKNTEFQAHQAILMARSPVLAAMLTHDTKEKCQKRIEINDIAPEIMKKLLHFMYSGEVALMSIDVAIPLLTAADKYALDDLKERCAECLSSQLDASNAVEFLNVADVRDIPHLKSKALDFISANKDTFANMEHSTAAYGNWSKIDKRKKGHRALLKNSGQVTPKSGRS